MLSTGSGEVDDGFLQVREIFDLRLNADLIVLSACQTGRGQGLPGEGIHGLSKAFLFAGARSIVASMWKIEDEATAALMSHFYSYLFHLILMFLILVASSAALALRARKGV